MKGVKKLNKWANKNTNIVFDILRVALGTFLFYKGVTFIGHTENIISVLQPVDELGAFMWISHYVAPAHLAGGLFVAIGMLTRISLAAQFPVLLGAVMVNFLGEMVMHDFIQAILAIIFCIFFLFYGSGKHSVDYKMKLNV